MLQKGVYPYENMDDLKKMNNCTHKNLVLQKVHRRIRFNQKT